MAKAERRRVFLLSPARIAGQRAQLFLNARARFDLAVRLRKGTASLGELFTFASGLYFRGKLTYAYAFAAPPRGVPGTLVITPGRGLVRPEALLDLEELRAMAAVPVDAADARYREPLLRDARLIVESAGRQSVDYILLGSVASPKYIEPLLDVFAERLLFPAEFVGRGDMSRGGLLLRCARAGVELNYVPALTAVRHGSRPAKLPRW